MGEWKSRVPPNIPDGLYWTRDGLRYLGVYLGYETIVQKHWLGTVEKLKCRLEKWKWIVPNLSYRGRTLVINNLLASSLWHRMSCIDPPAYLLGKIQSVLLDIFWDKLHWIPHNILYLKTEEGGQGQSTKQDCGFSATIRTTLAYQFRELIQRNYT